ncbi:MAG: hypothetical protein ACOCUI_03350, partial [bacterium]
MNKILNKFLKFEYDYKLFNEKLYNFNFWPYIRKDIYNQLIANKFHREQAHTNLFNFSFWERYSKLIKLSPNLITKNPIYNLNSKDLVILNHPRKIFNNNNDEYEDIYTEPWLNKIDGYSYYIFEKMYVGKHYPPSSLIKDNIRFLDIAYSSITEV